MHFIADLHIHSHFSRATSRDLVPRQLALWAQKKGILLLGTGDFTHPGWVAELKENLIEAEPGLFRLSPGAASGIDREVPGACRSETRFVLSGELSCIYKRGGKTRKVHHLILLPDFESLERLNRSLARIGNIRSDGRPILGLDSKSLLEIVLESSEKSFFIPAHIWTPWFSLFGSKSGFDTIEECFEDLTPHIRALETGLSSDPPMNRLLSRLDGYNLVSNSDAHSPAKLGREANLLETELGYDHLLHALSTGQGLGGTIEFFPEEGKYHLDGHRKCESCLEPEETLERGGLCPKCGKPLTVGVLSRVRELADRELPGPGKPFFSLIPLSEILSEILSCGASSGRVGSAYEDLLERLGPELRILTDCPLGEIADAGGPLLAEGIRRMRLNEVIRQAGYDGEYGVIRLFRDNEKSALAGQFGLFGPSRKSPPPSPRKQPRTKTVTRAARSSAEGKLSPKRFDPILDPLNPEQREAVLHEGSHLLIVAGPGTGKTLTLTHRIAHLVQSGKADPSQVLALTFTNKAAREMGGRTRLLLGDMSARVRASTFHGFCVEVLRSEGKRNGIPKEFTLCSEWDARKLAEQVVSDSGLKKPAARTFIKRLPLLKREKDPADPQWLLLQAYQEKLRGSSMLDLDDLECETMRLFEDHPDVRDAFARRYPWVFVDEYQDTNPVEVSILKTLATPRLGEVRVCAIGDPDQSIYGFRGSEVRSFHSFDCDFPGAKVVRLSRNYRSGQRILDGAASILDKQDPLQGQTGPGEIIRVAPCRSSAEEAEMIVAEIERLMGGTSHFSIDSGRAESCEMGEGLSFGDVSVLFRLNVQGDALEEAFERSGIPYARSGETPLILKHPVHLIWRFLLAALHPEIRHYRELYLQLPEVREVDGGSLLHRFRPKGSAGEVLDHVLDLHGVDLSTEDAVESLRRVKSLAEPFSGDLRGFLDRLSLDRAMDHEALPGDRVALMSLHAAKGLEWPVVFIAGCEEGLLPCTLFGTRDDEEEKRLFYVGMTRARHRLILSHAAQRILDGRPMGNGPSPFLKLIPADLCGPLERKRPKSKAKPQQQLGFFTR